MDVKKSKGVGKILSVFLGEIAGWNQTTAAKLVGIDRRRFNDYYNHRRETPYEILRKIVVIFKAHGIDCDEFTFNLFDRDAKKTANSERTNQVLVDKRWSKRRRGRPRKVEKINCHRDDNLVKKNRTDDQLAKDYGFTSRFVMRVAISVVEGGCGELIKLLDKETLSVTCLGKLAQMPKALQQVLIGRGEEAILAYFKQSEAAEGSEAIKPVSDDRVAITTVLKLAKKHPKFMALDPKEQALFHGILEDILYAARD